MEELDVGYESLYNILARFQQSIKFAFENKSKLIICNLFKHCFQSTMKE